MDGYKFIRIIQRRSKIVMVSKDGQKWVSLNDAIGVDGNFDAILKLTDNSLEAFINKS